MKLLHPSRLPLIVLGLLAGAGGANGLLAQGGRFGYQPERVPQGPAFAPEAWMEPEEGRFYIDRFGRRFRVYRARPYRPEGADGHVGGESLGDPGRDIPAVPRVYEDPLEVLREPGAGSGIPPVRRESAGRRQYPYGWEGEATPDLTPYPRPPAQPPVPERGWEPAQPPVWSPTPERRPSDLDSLPPSEFPPAVRRPGEARADMEGRMGAGPGNRERGREEAVVRDRTDVERPEGGFSPPMADRGGRRDEPVQAPVEEDPFAGLAYGKPVPGKKGFVTLEEHPNLPEIDVRGIAPGTPVEFPDPRDPEQMIQFRVPKFD